MRHIAVEGRCFVLAANQVAQAKDLSPSFATTYAEGDQIGQASVIEGFWARSTRRVKMSGRL